MGLCMADVMPRMQTATVLQENTIALCAYPVGCIHCAAGRQTSRISRCVSWWVGRPQISVDFNVDVGRSHIEGLIVVVFRIPAWNLFLEIGEAQDAAGIHI